MDLRSIDTTFADWCAKHAFGSVTIEMFLVCKNIMKPKFICPSNGVGPMTNNANETIKCVHVFRKMKILSLMSFSLILL